MAVRSTSGLVVQACKDSASTLSSLAVQFPRRVCWPWVCSCGKVFQKGYLLWLESEQTAQVKERCAVQSWIWQISYLTKTNILVH
jgi:hypothetical protein